MKKTILTTVLMVLTLSTSLLAKEINATNSPFNERQISKTEITPFCKAIIQGDVQTVKRFLSLGEDVNKKSLGMTPTMFAARYNKVEILSILIGHGADLTIKSNQGYNAKKYAELSNAAEALTVIESALSI